MKGYTLLEQLTAEMVGEVSTLYHQVQEIKGSLPSLLEDTTMQASLALQRNLKCVVDEIERSVQRERQFAELILSFERDAKQRIAHETTHVLEAEVKQAQRILEGIAARVLDQVRHEAARAAPLRWKIRFSFAMTVLILAAFVSGFLLASTDARRTILLTSDEIRQIEYGRQVEAVVPKLGRKTIELILQDAKK